MLFANHFIELNGVGEVYVPKDKIWYHCQKCLSKTGGKCDITCMTEV
jgi:hypothetical protein